MAARKKKPLTQEQRIRNQAQDEIDAELARASWGSIAKTAGSQVGSAIVGGIYRTPLNVHPIGMAVNVGKFAGDLARSGIDTYERVQMKRKGTPRQRAERAYKARKRP